MSTEATWDLYANYSPRSLCVFPLNSSSSSAQTPTSLAAGASSTVAVVYGTDRGSLHYRCYRTNSPTSPATRTGFLSLGRMSGGQQQSANSVLSSSSGAPTTGTGSNSTRIAAPLGMTGNPGGGGATSSGSSGNQRGSAGLPAATALPRMLYPVDLGSTSLPGPVISCIWINGDGVYLHNNAGLSLPPLFLVLVDDPRGSSAAQPGAYGAYWVSLQHGAFHVLNTNNRIPAFALPRLSAAVAAHGRVYATAGRSVFTLRVPTSALASLTETPDRRGSNSNSNNRGNANSKKKTIPQLQFGPRVWPGPVRCGPDALAVVAEGRVVVGCVGHAFYAVAGEEIHRDEDDDDNADDIDDEQYNTRALFAPTSSKNAIGGSVASDGGSSSVGGESSKNDCVKLVHWTQSSQVHPAVALDLGDASLEPDWSSVFLANGRECAVVDLYYGPPSQPRLSGSNKPRNGIVTTASPILAAAASWPFVAILMSDGLISVRSPSCVAVSLRTVEIGTRPNDFFTLRPVVAPGTSTIYKKSFWGEPNESSAISSTWMLPWIVGISYAGEAKVLQCRPDTAQDLADRLMRHAIDAFGGNGFPRTDLAKAVQASFTATSYVGPEATPQARILLKEYLEAVLGLCDWESGASSGWPTHDTSAIGTGSGSQSNTLAAAGGEGGGFQGKWMAEHGGANADKRRKHLFSSVLTASQPAALLTSTALLCLVASQLSPPAAALASRAAKACASEMGVVLSSHVDESAVLVGQQVTDQLLRESSQGFSLVRTPKTPTIPRVHRPLQVSTDYIEASIWLLRSCGQHESAMEVAAERLQQNPTSDSSKGSASGTGVRGGQWSRIKYESYTATHLSELWCCGQEDARELVLRSAATHLLLESNPPLGLSVFTALHPQNESQWRNASPRDDPFRSTDYVYRVVSLLKSILPKVPYDKNSNPVHSETYGKKNSSLPLESGRALAVSFLESAMGISTCRPVNNLHNEAAIPYQIPPSDQEDSHEERVANFHDELALLLLEGVISERSDEIAPSGEEDTELGRIYRAKLRHLLRWPLSKVRPDRILDSLPPSFLPEKALVLGRLGKHEEALKILYRDLKSLDLALEYCDDRHNRQQTFFEKQRARTMGTSGMLQDGVLSVSSPLAANDENNAYLPLIRVALESEDTEKGCAAAIQLLALRRTAIDRAAALRLLPPEIPVSAVARPFLIPALVDSESLVRRLTVVSALLRARYLRLKEQLTSAQLKAQANLQVVPQIQSLNLGEPLHSTKPFRARTSGGGSSGSSSNMPEVWIVKHFFPRHLVIQARVTNQAGLSEKTGRTLTDIAFVVAESSEEAIQPLLQVPIAVLPSSMTGSTWCVLSAAPTRMEGSSAQLTCELRYTTVGQGGDIVALTGQSSLPDMMGKSHVEELQDLEVHASNFS
ncbi:hypothetical protein ACA910_001392 [Epithemia clementina (nom. ined.)]